VRIREAAKAYVKDLRRRHRSDTLIVQTLRVLDRFASHLKENNVRDVRQTEEVHVVSFARMLRASVTPKGTPLSLATQAHYLERVKGFFAFLVRRGVLLRDPAAGLSVPAAASLPRVVLSPRQAEKLMSAPSSSSSVGRRDRALLELLYGTGLRRSECARLDVADVDLYSGTLLVRNGKGHRDRLVPVPERAARALDLYLREVRPLLLSRAAEPALFLTAWRGRRLSIASLVQLLQRHARAAGIERVHLHALRHTCATHLLRGGADIRHVQEILGHRWIKTTALYTRVDLDDLRRVIARAHPRERRSRKAVE
jgi:integrase/recombinase XerD